MEREYMSYRARGSCATAKRLKGATRKTFMFRNLHPHDFDPARSEKILVKAQENREDSEESGLEDVEAGAPPEWSGTSKPFVIPAR